ncbi:hypothetical protein [Leifsonia sp. Le1]|uniref:hypothetical protein n=1 Tax=Leifsonia sp. Le1 TaxID=3404918 RepID=UPI003EBACA01
MTIADDEAPYVLGQQRMTLAELRAELERVPAGTPSHSAPFWRSPVVVIGAAAVISVGALVAMWAALVATSV